MRNFMARTALALAVLGVAPLVLTAGLRQAPCPPQAPPLRYVPSEKEIRYWKTNGGWNWSQEWQCWHRPKRQPMQTYQPYYQPMYQALPMLSRPSFGGAGGSC